MFQIPKPSKKSKNKPWTSLRGEFELFTHFTRNPDEAVRFASKEGINDLFTSNSQSETRDRNNFIKGHL